MTPNILLEAALAHHVLGRPVIPVQHDKRPACGAWGHWRYEPQTEQDVRALFDRPVHGIGLLTWPASELAVLDFDGPHAAAAWERAGIPLPPTARQRTGGGGEHRIYRVPPDSPRPGPEATAKEFRRKVRLVADPACGCAKPCGVDLLFNGYFIVPPTPGYQEDPDAPFEPGNIAVIPQEVLDLARAAARENGDARARADRPGETIPHGRRNAALTSLAGTMRRRGMTEEAIRAALVEENARRCNPPLPEAEVRGIAVSIGRYAPEAGDGRPAEPPPDEAPQADLPPFPEGAYQGLAAEVAGLYAETIEAPREFLYLDALAFLGALVTVHVRLDSELREEPRLFTVKIGPSWASRKSSGQEAIERFYKPILQDRVTMCYGTGSAEGLALRMKNGLPAILVYDEFRSFVDKSGVQQSVLLPMVASLFSRTVYENATKNSEILLADAHLSLVGSCTTETFRTMFSAAFRNIGFLNRLFVVAGKRTTLKPRPGGVPSDAVRRLQDRVLAQVERAEREKPVLRFTADAGRRWDEWYMALPESPYAARLDSYGLRLLMLFAVTTESWEITAPLVDAVLPLLDYERVVRKELDPVDAEGVVARMEGLILRHLSKGRMPTSRLHALCHTSRYGLWCFDQALVNLRRQGWIGEGKAGRGVALWLTEAGREAVSQP